MVTGELPNQSYSDDEIGKNLFNAISSLKEDSSFGYISVVMNVGNMDAYGVFTLRAMGDLSDFMLSTGIDLQEEQFGSFYRQVADIRSTIPPAFNWYTRMMLPPDMVGAEDEVIKEWLDQCESHRQRLVKIAKEKGVEVTTLVDNPDWVFEQALVNMGINISSKPE